MRVFIVRIIFLLILFAPLTAWSAETGAVFVSTTPNSETKYVNLAVPHLWEIPDGVWVKPWNGACEEASIAMIDQFYLKQPKLTFNRIESKQLMRPLFNIEDKIFGYNSNTNAAENAKLINYYTNFSAKIKQNPTLEEIKNELQAGRPVISMHYGYALNNPRHSFRRGGSSYHVLVIKGFEEAKKQFLVNDSELKGGLDFRYNYDTILKSLRDFNHAANKANGAPVVIFTAPKTLLKEKETGRIYLVVNDKKYYISHPKVFTNHRWNWKIVTTAPESELEQYETSNAIKE